MNENTAKLLEQLANKMGTTSEYLWNILLRQASIDATITLIQYALLAIAGIALYKIHLRLSKPIKSDTYGSDWDSYSDNDFYGVIMVASLIVYSILIIAAFFCVGSVINGYFNPEYWALDRLLDAVKSSK